MKNRQTNYHLEIMVLVIYCLRVDWTGTTLAGVVLTSGFEPPHVTLNITHCEKKLESISGTAAFVPARAFWCVAGFFYCIGEGLQCAPIIIIPHIFILSHFNKQSVSRVERGETHKRQFSIDLKVVGTLRVPSAIHSLGIYTARGACLLLCIPIYRS